MKALIIALALVVVSAIVGACQSVSGWGRAGITGAVSFAVPTALSMAIGALIFTILRLIFGGGWIVRTVSCILSASAVVAALWYIAGKVAGPNPTDGTALALLYMLLFATPPLAALAGLFGAGVCRRARP